MPSERREQINFRVSARFRQRIESECIKRDMSLQDVVTTALKFYFQTPPEDWEKADLIAMAFSDDERGTEERVWVELWIKFMNAMPEEKTRLMVEIMKLDLLHYRSSRRKAALKKRRRAAHQEESDVEARSE
jgi:hypothetical protein